MFSAYKSVIVTPCVCDLFVSKVTKIMDVCFWWSFFGSFSVCDDCILKSTTAWLLKLSVLYIHSFRWFRSDAVIFRLFKVFSSSLQHIWHIQGKHSHTQISGKLKNNLNKLLKRRTVQVLHQTTVPMSDHWRRLQHTFLSVFPFRYLVGTSDITTISNDWGNILQISCKTLLEKKRVSLCRANAWIGTHTTFPVISKRCCRFSVVQSFQFEFTTHLTYIFFK